GQRSQWLALLGSPVTWRGRLEDDRIIAQIKVANERFTAFAAIASTVLQRSIIDKQPSETCVARPSDKMELFLDVLAFAAHKHRRQRRKDRGASAYINHPIALARVLHNEGNISDLTTISAAMLHDTIEDTRTKREELARTFGKEIAQVVAEVTDNKRLHK